jgi:hypothetical protein
MLLRESSITNVNLIGKEVLIMKLPKTIILTIILIGLLVTGSQAAVLTFFGEDLGPLDANSPLPNSDAAQADFLSNLVGVGTEDFEGIAVGTTAPVVLNFGLDTATLNGDGYIRDDFPISPAGRFPTSGTHYWSTDSTANNFVIDFSVAQAAFGFYGTDVGDFAGQLLVTLLDGSTLDLTIPHTINAPNASAIYFGVIVTDPAEVFTSVAFAATSSDDYFGFDDMTIGRLSQVQVLEPSTFLLLGFGLAGVGLLRRKFRK